MAKECIIEFYFRSDQLVSLLNRHPGAKGIIVSQEIVSTKLSNGKKVNVVNIKARVDRVSKAKPKVTKAGKLLGGGPGDGSIDGCPYPPGCTDDGGNG